MKRLSKLIFVFSLVLFGLSTVKAQTSLKDDEAMKKDQVRDLIQNKDFVFKASATTAMQDSGKNYVAIAKDTLVVKLPNAVKFNSTQYAYNSAEVTNGGWMITISPKSNMTNVKKMRLLVTPLGHASLEVIYSHGSPLELQGYIKQEDY